MLPNLSNFKIMGSRQIIQGAMYQPADPLLYGSSLLYCIAYCAVIVSLAVVIFLRRDFK
jgi:ABC-type transport system involved in multi-copper enzyme maturation permease subunit